jgi:hypothetical protein
VLCDFIFRSNYPSKTAAVVPVATIAGVQDVTIPLFQ